MLSPDDGCRHCGTIDGTHMTNCPSLRRKLPGVRPRPKARQIGDDCLACEGPCKYGQCSECRGHSEHNVGCPTLG